MKAHPPLFLIIVFAFISLGAIGGRSEQELAKIHLFFIPEVSQDKGKLSEGIYIRPAKSDLFSKGIVAEPKKTTVLSFVLFNGFKKDIFLRDDPKAIIQAGHYQTVFQDGKMAVGSNGMQGYASSPKKFILLKAADFSTQDRPAFKDDGMSIIEYRLDAPEGTPDKTTIEIQFDIRYYVMGETEMRQEIVKRTVQVSYAH